MNAALTTRDRVRGETLRLVLEGVAQSMAVGFLVSTLMLVVLWTLAPHDVLVGWYVAFLAGRLTMVIFSRRTVRAARDPDRDRRSERLLLVLKVYEGCVLGTLLWIGLPAHVPAVSILMMSLMAAICGNGVSLLAPRPPLYLALVVPLVTLAVVSLWSLGGVPYRTLAAFCILYVVGQYGQVRLANRRIRESIELQFENVALLDQLRAETDSARRAREQAEHADAAKSHFLAAASHDLRQPVHALGLFLQALSQTRLQREQRKILESAQAASGASADMLDTFLDFSRLEAGVVTPRPATVALQPLLDKLENELAPLADAKGLIYRSPPSDTLVISDVALLELVLRNLILNAIRYTDRGGLLIGCRRRGGAVSIEVHDTGIGIPDDQREAIFREFHQLGNPERDRRKGLGLGLAIVRGLAASLGHPLSLSSTQGRGSVFRILVPQAGPGAFPSLVDRRTPVDLAAGALAGKRVLIIDDDAIVREAMVQLLSGWGCRSLAIETPEKLGALPAQQAPDAVICDYRLRENRTGTEAIALVRRHWGMDIPALMITGDTAPERMREAIDSGIPLIHKPVAPDALYRSLSGLIVPFERAAPPGDAAVPPRTD